MELKKRTWTYIQPPSVHEMASCSCGNENTQWSEYEKHLWCDKCQKDFIPEHGGIFDGPVGIGAARICGITFDCYNLETKQIELLDDFVQYIVCYKLQDILLTKKIPIEIKEKKAIKDTVIIHKGILSFNSGEIIISTEEQLSGHIENNFTTTINIGYPNSYKIKLNLNISSNLQNFTVNEDENLLNFKQFLLNKELEYTLKTNEKIKRNNKI